MRKSALSDLVEDFTACEQSALGISSPDEAGVGVGQYGSARQRIGQAAADAQPKEQPGDGCPRG
jgi:hypothetical protein